ncbi:MAG: hypothetical protein M1306_00465 [Candidatus Thermoplasmatota archaeon]|jgi:GTPase SAR1 family protein|nr:hypothetical protein [Candidatus Thermoplasmatota archaeon]
MEPKRAWKVSLIGPKGVGKSSLISRVVYGSEGYESDPKSLKKKSVAYDKDGIKFMADLFFLELDGANGTDKLLSGSNAIVVVTDVTNPDSLFEADNLLKYVQMYNGKTAILMAATKQDLKYEAKFWDSDIKKVADKYSVRYVLTSSRNSADSARFLDTLLAALSEKFAVKGRN